MKNYFNSKKEKLFLGLLGSLVFGGCVVSGNKPSIEDNPRFRFNRPSFFKEVMDEQLKQGRICESAEVYNEVPLNKRDREQRKKYWWSYEKSFIQGNETNYRLEKIGDDSSKNLKPFPLSIFDGFQ